MIDINSPIAIVIVTASIGIVGFLVKGWTGHVVKKIDRIGKLVYKVDKRLSRVEDKIGIEPNESIIESTNGDY